MVEVKRKEGESPESLMRRFQRVMLQSRILEKVKERQHYQKEKSKRLKRAEAIIRKKFGEKKEYLRKTGKLKEEDEPKRKTYRRF